MNVVESGLSLLAPKPVIGSAVASPVMVSPTAAAMAVATNTSAFNTTTALPVIKAVTTVNAVLANAVQPAAQAVANYGVQTGIKYTYMQLIMVAIAAVLIAVCVFYFVRYVYQTLKHKEEAAQANDVITESSLISA